MHCACHLTLVLCQLLLGLRHLMLDPCELRRQTEYQPRPSLSQLQLSLPQLLLSLYQLGRTLERLDGGAIGQSVSRRTRKLEMLDGGSVRDLR
jgi:hypothetical protein